MINWKGHIAFLALLSVFAFSCEKAESIEDFPIVDPTLVLNSEFTADSQFVFQISRSLSILDNAELKMIPDAKLYLYENGLLFDSIIDANSDEEYKSTYFPRFDADYQVKVMHPDYNSIISSVETLPSDAFISNVSFQVIDSTILENIGLGSITQRDVFKGLIEFDIIDSDKDNVYYELSIIHNDSLFISSDSTFSHVSNNHKCKIECDDPLFEVASKEYNFFAGNETTSYIISDELFNGSKYHCSFEFEYYKWNLNVSNYYLQVTTRNRSGYLYNKSFFAFIESNNDPFSEPVHVFSNIENGYGIFTGYSNSSQHIHRLDFK